MTSLRDERDRSGKRSLVRGVCDGVRGGGGKREGTSKDSVAYLDNIAFK